MRIYISFLYIFVKIIIGDSMLDFIINFGKTEFLILLAMIPEIILGIIIYKKDVVEKELISLLIKLFLCGILSSFIALLFEIYLERFLSVFSINKYMLLLIKSFFTIALVEELVKWLFTYVICYNKKEFNYEYDAIVYSSFVALGFASVENIIAILGNGFDISFAIKRSLITVPAHSFFAISSGYYLGKAKRYNKRNWFKKSKKYIIFSLLLPIFIHGMFDYLLFVSTNISLILETLLIVYLYITSYIKIKKTYKKDKIK